MFVSSPLQDLFRPVWLAWLGRAGHYSLGLLPFCPIGMVLCVEDSSADDIIAREYQVRIFSLERSSGRRTVDHGTAADGIVPFYREQINRELRQASGRRVITGAFPSRSLEDLSTEMGCETISNPSHLTAWLNDKRNLQNALRELSLPLIRGRWTDLMSARYAGFAAEMGSSLVLQIAQGAAGSGTIFARSEDEFEAAAKRFAGHPVWVTPDLGELSVNINALALEAGVVVSCPSIQLEGLAVASASRGTYCGNDYVAAAHLSPSIVGNLMEQTSTVGRWLTTLGYRGLFGLDFVIEQSTQCAYAVDLNPRWQGSTALLTMAEHKAGRLPLAVADLACALGLMSATEIVRRRDEFLEPVRASHLALRCPAAGWVRVAGDLRPGIYSLAGEDGMDGFVRPGLRLDDLQLAGELLVGGGVPRTGTLLAPKTNVLRFCSEDQMVDSRFHTLERTRAAAERLYCGLELAPVEAK
jgi:hypothetical protein